MMSKAESILLWSANLQALGSGLLGPLYAVFAQDVGGDVFELSWVYALYLATVGFGMVCFGRVADRYGHEYFSIVGLAVMSLATFSYLLVSTMTGLLLVQIVMGLGMAVQGPSWSALYDRHSGDGANDGYVWGLSYGLWYVFQGISILVGGYVASRYSFELLFVVLGSLMALSTIVQARILRYRVQ